MEDNPNICSSPFCDQKLTNYFAKYCENWMCQLHRGVVLICRTNDIFGSKDTEEEEEEKEEVKDTEEEEEEKEEVKNFQLEAGEIIKNTISKMSANK
jgi:hypothetical protein